MPEVWPPKRYIEKWLAAHHASNPPDILVRVLEQYDLGPGIGVEQSVTNIARYTVQKYEPRLMLVHLTAVDSMQHRHGPESPQALQAIEAADRHIGELLQAYQDIGALERTLVAVVSDHGFVKTKHEFHINVLLREAGLIEADEGDETATDYRVASWYFGGSCGIVLKDPHDMQALAALRHALASHVNEVAGPIARIVEAEELAKRGVDSRIAMILDAGGLYKFGTNMNGPLVTDTCDDRNPYTGTHGHLPDRKGLEATFVVSGPGVESGKVIENASMTDVAPTVAHLLKLKLPNNQGKLLQAMVQTAPPSERP